MRRSPLSSLVILCRVAHPHSSSSLYLSVPLFFFCFSRSSRYGPYLTIVLAVAGFWVFFAFPPVLPLGYMFLSSSFPHVHSTMILHSPPDSHTFSFSASYCFSVSGFSSSLLFSFSTSLSDWYSTHIYFISYKVNSFCKFLRHSAHVLVVVSFCGIPRILCSVLNGRISLSVSCMISCCLRMYTFCNSPVCLDLVLLSDS